MISFLSAAGKQFLLLDLVRPWINGTVLRLDGSCAEVLLLVRGHRWGVVLVLMDGPHFLPTFLLKLGQRFCYNGMQMRHYDR